MIRNRLILYFVVLTSLALLSSSLYIEKHLRDELENELGAKLLAIAGVTASTIDAELLTLLGPGDEDTRTFAAFSRQLEKQKTAANMKRILITTPGGEIWLDTDHSSIGTPYARFALYEAERKKALQGTAVRSFLFQHSDGAWFMSSFAPLESNAQIVGLIVVEGSAASLALINRVRKNLLTIGIIVMLFAVVIASIVSQRLTAPIFTLQQASKEIEKGNLETPIQVNSSTEIQDLAKTMEDMRKAIILRDKRQRGMLAGVAHEIRNPLGGIELFGGLLRTELTMDSQRQKLDRILQETRQIGKIATHFIDFATPMQPEKTNCNLADIIAQAYMLCEQPLTAKKISLMVQGDADLYADALQVRQILLNLLLNAIDACTENGRISISIEQDASATQLTFGDNGSGIAFDKQKDIFEPFFSTKEKGSGLGLAMTQKLMELNDGRISLKKSDADGTTFILIFARRQA